VSKFFTHNYYTPSLALPGGSTSKPGIIKFVKGLPAYFLNIPLVSIRYNYRRCFQMFHTYTPFTKFGPALEQSLYTKNHEIYNFGRHLPAIYYYAFNFSTKCAVLEKNILENRFKNRKGWVALKH
jgi:hypothetical protein